MISGLLKPDSGRVQVDGKEFWSDPTSAQRKMGVVPQEIALYEELSGRENLEFWGRLAGLPRGDACSQTGAQLESLSLSERAGDPIKKYSGGMKRRINLGCALMHQPKLLLLDEPTAMSNSLYEEVKHHTLARTHTLCPGVMPIVAGKMLFAA